MFKPVLLTSLVATIAWGTTEFPSEIQAKYSLPQLPPLLCGLCHTNGETRSGTVTTPIGAALRQRGLRAGDTASLLAALDQLEAESVDSDSDGVIDVAELIAGSNPNVADSSTGGGGGTPIVEVPPARFGCGASVAGWFPFVLGGLLLLRRRR